MECGDNLLIRQDNGIATELLAKAVKRHGARRSIGLKRLSHWKTRQDIDAARALADQLRRAQQIARGHLFAHVSHAAMIPVDEHPLNTVRECDGVSVCHVSGSPGSVLQPADTVCFVGAAQGEAHPLTGSRLGSRRQSPLITAPVLDSPRRFVGHLTG